jgi:hypothetical protein
MLRVIISSLSMMFVVSALRGQGRPLAADTVNPARRCAFTRGPKESIKAFVRRCAEDFVTRNGYTSVPPTSDSSLWATESIQFAPSWQAVFQQRHNQLVPKAEGIGCSKTSCSATFRFSGSDPCVFRAVTMGKDGKGMRMEHQSGVPVPGSAAERKCRNP